MALARKPFVVIDAEILSSSIWSEAQHVRLVWFTLLILCDTEGCVGAALPGIARAAGVSLEEAEDAMRKFEEPDPYSRTQDNEGRRVERIPRGWRVLNFEAHIARLSKERAKSRDRVRKWRARQKKSEAGNGGNGYGNVSVTVGNREQGVGNRDNDGRKEDGPPALPPADRAERAIKATTDGLRTKLYALVEEATRLDPKNRDAVEIMRMFTSYDKGDGRSVKGVVNAALLTHERLEKSIQDAEDTIAGWRKRGEARG